MKNSTPDHSEFQSIDHINAFQALEDLTTDLKGRIHSGLPWISCSEVREYFEQEQADLLKQVLDFSEIWKKYRKECGRIPEYPGASMTRQSPKLDNFTAHAIMLVQAFKNYEQGEMLATCDLLYDALEKERGTVQTLSCQIEILEAKAGESDALRGQIDALKITVKTLEDGIADKQAVIDQFRAISKPKQKKITLEEAAEIITRARNTSKLKGITSRTLQNWESGSTATPDWYPGRNITVFELAERAKQGAQQDRVKKAMQKGLKNKIRYNEEQDQHEE